jgi:hypothetical protein
MQRPEGAITTTVKTPLRVYADTSVFGGCFDVEFKDESVRFFEEVRLGQFIVVVSNVTLDELELAPDPVRGVLAGLPPEQVEIVSTSRRSRTVSETPIWKRRLLGQRRATTRPTLPWRPFPTWIW